MRNRVVKAFCKVPMNLQLFAEGGDGAGADGGNGGGSGEGAGGEGGAGGDTPPSFDDFLKTGGNQAEFDRRVQKAVNTAVTKAQEKWQALADDKLSEAEKLAKMTKEEKAQYMQQKRDNPYRAKEYPRRTGCANKNQDLKVIPYRQQSSQGRARKPCAAAA